MNTHAIISKLPLSAQRRVESGEEKWKAKFEKAEAQVKELEAQLSHLRTVAIHNNEGNSIVPTRDLMREV